MGASYASIDMELSIADTMIRMAFDNNMVDARVLNAFSTVKRKLRPGSNVRSRILHFDEYLNLIAVAPQHLKPIIITGYNTGMRMGELLKLQWQFIDRQRGFIRLPLTITKEGRHKIIPINHHVDAVLKRTPRALMHDFVFTYQGRSFSEGGIKRSFRTACKNARIAYGRKTPNGLTFHDIRRTFKNQMMYAGIDKAYRDAIVGHRLKGMDIYYLVLSEESLKEAMKKYTV